ncbi:adenylate/guanylate cyclase domain-containing protein [Siccirubricoccus phaeus]|uniref:adenylate/guanylate cyclase domain-containing protein n=1 Tax=Siccirubricoccus phaeus TaxID=2595053 RepID=UPI0011F36094|nr:adenylate/guanylate cyclase domain-containing protein [Siccirubricoccus phaeus]
MSATFPLATNLASKRQFLAVLAADIAGYTRLMENGEEATHLRFTALMDGIVRPLLAARGGRIVKNTGDGFLATFESALQATECALQIQDRIAGAAAHESGPAIAFRMGLNYADIIVEPHDVFGEGVNLAARLQALAEPGGVIVSAEVAEQLGANAPLPLLDLGEISLKHIRRPARAFALGRRPAPPAEEPELPALPSIAVLPFRLPPGADPEDAWFAEGLIEGIVSVLSGIEALFVIATAATHAYAGRVVDPRQVAQDLGVRYVLTGSAWRAGEKLRITTELCDAATGAVLRADRHDGAARDLFDMQDRIATELVALLAPSVQERELRQAMRKAPDSMTGYDYLLQALDVMHRVERDSFDAARGLLQQAIAAAPDWAKPRSHAALWHMVRINQGWSPNPYAEFPEVAQLAASALERDPHDAVALAIQALMLCFAKRDYETAKLLIDRATAAGPNCALAWGIAGFIRACRGDWRMGVEAGHKALRLSPHARLASLYEHAITLTYLIGGQYAEAVEWGRRTERRNPTCVSNQRALMAALVALGEEDEARERAARLLRQEPGFRLSVFAAHSALSGPILERFLTLLRAAGLPD